MKPAGGVYCTRLSTMDAVPSCGGPRKASDSASPSASVSFASTSTVATPAGTFTRSVTATGASFTSVTVSAIVAVVAAPLASVARTTNWSVPRKSCSGVTFTLLPSSSIVA